MVQIAEKYGMVPILARDLSMPEQFVVVAHGNSVEDLQDYQEAGHFGRLARRMEGYPSPQPMFAIVRRG